MSFPHGGTITQMCTNARLFLDLVAASGEPKLWDLTPPDARKKVIELTRMVECQEAIGKIEDRTLAGPAGPLPFRVYTPLTANAEPSGGIIFFHGGAWVLGDREPAVDLLLMMQGCSHF